MSISEISEASVVPERSSVRISVTAARALGPGAVRIVASSSSVSPLITGAPGETARRSSPSTWPSSSIQCRRAAWTSVNGRRSSTTIVTRFGSSRTMSARRISGSEPTRAATAPLSSVHRFAPGAIAAAARIRGTGTRDAPRTSTATTANRGDVTTQRAPASTSPRPPTRTATTAARRVRRASARARRRAVLTRCRATSGVRSPRSASEAAPRGESRPRLLTEDADLGLERDPEMAVDALARDLHEAQDVSGPGAAAIDDEVAVLGRDLGAVDALSAQPRLFDEPRGQIARGVLPDEARGRERQRLGRLLLLEARADFFLDLGQRPPMQLQPAADEHGARRKMEGAITEGARRLELTERAVGVQVIHGADEIADAAVGGARVHGERATDGGGNADQALDAAQIERGRLAYQRRQRHARAGQRLLALEFGAAQAALELEDDAAHAAVAHEQVVAAADDGDGQLLALGEHQRVADVLDVLRHDEDVRGTADA